MNEKAAQQRTGVVGVCRVPRILAGRPCVEGQETRNLILTAFLILIATACGWANGQETITPTPHEIPYYFIAIHNEPYHFPGGRRALGASYRTLVEMVERADEYQIKLTLMFAPQWADFIADDSERMDLLAKWKNNGHEIAGHHHSIYHGNWDGYTNYPVRHALAERARHTPRPERYLGTLKDFLAKVRKLEPTLQCGCMNDEFDKKSLPDGIVFDTCSGFANFGPLGRRLGDGVDPEKGRNEYVSVGRSSGVTRRWLTHYQITTHERQKAAQGVFQSMSEGVYGVVTHSIQSQAAPYFEFLGFLHSEDPTGERSRTVSAVINENLLPEKALPEELLRAENRPSRQNFGPPRRGDAEIFRLVAELKQLLRKQRAEGVDVSKAVELDEQSRAAFQTGDKEKCRQLLREAVDLLRERSEE
jgi:hypothetical protein